VTTKKKPRSAEGLVGSARAKTTSASWYDLLQDEDKTFVLDVVCELKRNRSVSVQDVAKALIEELKLSVGIQSVAKWLAFRRDHA
jgi:hypothetical protein